MVIWVWNQEWNQCTSRIIAYCCSGIAVVLSIRSNISHKKKRKKYKITILLRFRPKTATIWFERIFFENF